ncbi:cupin domain-containing protein [Candidatus Marimicrobium litorale]|uniref:Cupin domain-containing protein n=1 Tax=Candidatus Marimicrobium litorale TaxID=2518991 RepID=A0ABT3T6V8_9GAMM|nr:cupin domain-containing protein [Candidatus Marimicrobium litorale]MCX2978007.1 cupin domain-containing protein [Candidatus Marimicrobium litorale]
MPLDPGPMRVMHNFFKNKSEVLADIDRLDLWPTVYVSDRMEELPLHWHDVDNCGYVMEGKSYVLNENGARVELSAGDKLVIPAGAIHAEGEVTERMVYIVGLGVDENLFDKLTLLDPAESPLVR